jgi:hypothetical protein
MIKNCVLEEFLNQNRKLPFNVSPFFPYNADFFAENVFVFYFNVVYYKTNNHLDITGGVSIEI